MPIPENEDGLTGDIFNMEPRGNVFSGGQSYGIVEHAADSVGPVVLSQQENAEITRKIQASPLAAQQSQQPGQQVVQPGTGTGSFTPAPINMQDAEARKRGEWEPGYIDVPKLPPGADLAANVEKAKKMYNPLTFYNHVKTGGEWDYKKAGEEYEPGGNFNFGVVAKAYGLPEWVAKVGAGAYQIASRTSNPEFGGPSPLFKSKYNPDLDMYEDTTPFLYKYSGVIKRPHGDDPMDQYEIEKGFRYYDQHFKK